MAYGDFKDLAKRTVSDKVLTDKAFSIAKNMVDMKEVLLLWFINCLTVVLLIMKLNKMNNQQKNYTNQLLKNLKEEKYINHLKTIFGVLI